MNTFISISKIKCINIFPYLLWIFFLTKHNSYLPKPIPLCSHQWIFPLNVCILCIFPHQYMLLLCVPLSII